MALNVSTRRMLRVSAGFFCLALGVAGLILPILQGWLFLGIGVVLLSKDILFFRRLSDGVRRRYPPVDRAMRQADRWVRRMKLRYHRKSN